MRRARLVVAIAASALAAPTPAARLALVGATVLTASGCTKCNLEITTPDPLPDGAVGQAYFVQMKASTEGCDERPLWSDTKDLPPSMKLSRDGALDGVPSRAGTYSFGVKAFILGTDSDYSSDSAEVTRRYTLTIHPR